MLCCSIPWFKYLYWKDILIVARKKMFPEIKIDKFAKRRKRDYFCRKIESICESVELPTKRLLYVTKPEIF